LTGKFGHVWGLSSIRLTVDTYGHLIPGANRAAVDRLEDTPTPASASQTHPQPFDAATLAERAELFEESGESDFHELEPIDELVAPSRAPQACGLGRVPGTQPQEQQFLTALRLSPFLKTGSVELRR